MHRQAYPYLLATVLLATACRSEAPVEDNSLLEALALVQEDAVAAGIIDAAGGSIVVTQGAWAGAGLEIPEGALTEPALFSLTATAPVGGTEGYLEAGPALAFRTTAARLEKPVALQLPILPAFLTEGVDGLLLLHRLEDTLTPVAGAVRTGAVMAAVVHELGDFQAVVDDSIIGEGSGADDPQFCESALGSVTLAAAVSGTRTAASLSLDTPKLYAVSSSSVDDCGRALNWEVEWYSTTDGQSATLVYPGSGSLEPILSDTLPCAGTIVEYSPDADSPAMLADYKERRGEGFGELSVTTLSCAEGFSQPRVRIAENARADAWADYAPDGTWLDGEVPE